MLYLLSLSDTDQSLKKIALDSLPVQIAAFPKNSGEKVNGQPRR